MPIGIYKRKPRLLSDQFNKFVIKQDGCWGWKGSHNRAGNGYGEIRNNKKKYYAHRVSWELHNGPIPDGMWVLHKCDNSICSNPDHLFLGNHKDNMKDMAIKERSGSTTLTSEQVKYIKDSDKLTAHLSKQFNVSPTAIHYIKIGRNWKHLTP